MHTSGLFVRAAYTFLDTEVLDVDDAPGQAPAPFTVGDPLIRRAKHQASLELRYARGRASAFALVTGRGRMLDLEPNFASATFFNDGHAIVTLGGAWRVHRTLEAYARVANLFDRAYEDVLGFPAPGVTAVAGLRVAVGR
jgi:outer membrane cobalamin receptor